MNATPDEPAGKLWELLRRNNCFHKAVRRLTQLRLRAESDNAEESRRAREVGCWMLARIEGFNVFAADALRWLVPMPQFLHEEAVLPRNYDRQKKGFQPRIVLRGRGLTPNPRDETWEWFEGDPQQRPRGAVGWPTRWGPTIATVTTKVRRLRHLCHDGIAEWRAYFPRRQFTLETPWDESPPRFQRAFRHYWTQLTRGSHEAWETDFFQGWDLSKTFTHAACVLAAANAYILELVNDLDRVRAGKAETVCPPSPTKGGCSVRQVREFMLDFDRVAKELNFRELASHRVFVIPRLLLKGEVKPVFDKLAKQLAAELPERHRQLLGSTQFWSEYLIVDRIRRCEGVETREAIRRHIMRRWVLDCVRRELKPMAGCLGEQTTVSPGALDRWYPDGVPVPKPDKKTHRRDFKEWRAVKKHVQVVFTEQNPKKRPDLKNHVQFMDSLVRDTFPRLDLNILLRKPPYKRKGVK